MDNSIMTIAKQVAQAASDFQLERTGHAPRSITVVLSEETLVITLHEGLSPAERILARNPDGEIEVQEFHRRQFENSAHSLRQEIKRITRAAVSKTTTEIEAATGDIVYALTTGPMVKVFQLVSTIPEEHWDGADA